MIDEKQVTRFEFLKRVITKEVKYLRYSEQQVFSKAFTLEVAKSLANDQVFSEKVEAFVSRFCRLQDTIGDKLLPFWLQIVGEGHASFVDNLNKAEKLNMLESAEQWVFIRQIRNQMVHEYIEDQDLLVSAFNKAQENIDFILQFANNLLKDLEQRFKS